MTAHGCVRTDVVRALAAGALTAAGFEAPAVKGGAGYRVFPYVKFCGADQDTLPAFLRKQHSHIRTFPSGEKRDRLITRPHIVVIRNHQHFRLKTAPHIRAVVALGAHDKRHQIVAFHDAAVSIREDTADKGGAAGAGENLTQKQPVRAAEGQLPALWCF